MLAAALRATQKIDENRRQEPFLGVPILQCDIEVTRDEWLEPAQLTEFQVAGFGGSDMSPALNRLAFQSARVVLERKRAEEELCEVRSRLEMNVAARTAELRSSHDALAAVRRVATLVAEGIEPQELFAVVAEQVARVVDVPLVSVIRYETDGTGTECANYSAARKAGARGSSGRACRSQGSTPATGTPVRRCSSAGAGSSSPASPRNLFRTKPPMRSRCSVRLMRKGRNRPTVGQKSRRGIKATLRS